MSYVCVDASAAVKWLLPEEYSDEALALYEDCYRAGTLIAAPPHFPVEVTNAIRRRVARHLVTHAEGKEILETFAQFQARLVIPPNLYREALDLAEAFNRPTVYDTHYIALAQILGCDLWTADEALLNALGNKLTNVKSIRGYQSEASQTLDKS